MTLARSLSAEFRRLMLGSLLALLAAAAPAGPAAAQMVVVIVNGEPITNYDIEQRTKLTQLSTHKTPARKEVIDELIDEHLKIQLLKRFSIEGIDKDVDNAVNNMARRMRTTPKQFAEQLGRSGVGLDTLKHRIKAEIIWSQIIRGRFQSSFQFSEKDIQARLQAKGLTGSVGYDYTLRPILFIVPRGSPHERFEARRKEAETFRSRFKSCEHDLPYARALPYVAVRAPVVKSSAELAPALREILEKTEIGGVTAPEITLQGVEVFALCGKRPSDSDNAPAKREARDELFKEQFEMHSQRLIKELRSQAMIEYR